jgi:phosphatidylserine decarboxylase
MKFYCSCFKINFAESSHPADSYPSLLKLFLRDLKTGARPIPENSKDFLLSPVDGQLREILKVTLGSEVNVKGCNWDWSKLLLDSATLSSFEGGDCFNLYLSPKDYHHVHVPYTGVIKSIQHIPGSLLPVNDWSVKTFPNLFSINERVIIEMQAESFSYLLIFVGALNVGSILLDPCPNFKRGFLSLKPKKIVEIAKSKYSAGERIGSFALGSSILLVLPVGIISEKLSAPQSVKFGSILSKVNFRN